MHVGFYDMLFTKSQNISLEGTNMNTIRHGRNISGDTFRLDVSFRANYLIILLIPLTQNTFIV